MKRRSRKYFTIKFFDEVDFYEIKNVERVECSVNGKLLIEYWSYDNISWQHFVRCIDPLDYEISIDFNMHELEA